MEDLKSVELILTTPNSLSKSYKRWRRAFTTIYCSRAFILTRTQPIINRLDQIVKNKELKFLLDSGGVTEIAAALHTHTDSGISGDETDILKRRKTFGSNTFVKPSTRGFMRFVREAFKDPTIIILLFCAALSLGFGIKQYGVEQGWYDGGSIFLAVFLVIGVSSVSNYRQSRQFDKLSSKSNDIRVEAVRGGRRQSISIFEVVVGDVVRLKIGDQVPADGIFLNRHSLQVDESSMTGESEYVDIDLTPNPFLTSGTKVVDGYGQMLVTSVGMSTSWGEMMSSATSYTNEETPLQVRLNKLTSSIGKFGLAVAFLVLVVLLARYFTGHTKDDDDKREFTAGSTKANDVMNAVVKIVAAAVTIVVVAIPEGLPLAVTLTLAYSMKRMMADNAMVRKLSACETMGSATTICTDKTGTLTMNQMKVTKFWLGREHVESTSQIDDRVLELVNQGVALNTTGTVYQDSVGKYEFSGSPTEKAILSWATMDLKMDIDRINKSFEIVHVEVFNSDKKRSGVVYRGVVEGAVHVQWKGAAEMVIAMCSSYYEASGEKREMNDNLRLEFEEIVHSMAACCLRCIAFAHAESQEKDQRIKEEGLTLLGVVGIKDPCRPGAKKAVQDCQNAGVNIKMITGDNVFTAKAIATECGILRFHGQEDQTGAVIEGQQFRNFSETERMETVDKIRVMARSSPIDKLLMVQCLRQKGHIVAVTGDGTNDAPALKEADIGLSMGIQGTEVAKESSDIVILDDNFASVVTVLEWGRCVYNNIQKFIQFQLTVNVAALTINFIAAVTAGEVPLTAVQLLWVNLIMDTLGALALATERPTGRLMRKAPVCRAEPLITNIMWRNLIAQALYQIGILLALQFKGEEIFGVDGNVKDTLVFNTFVFCQVFNEFNARELEKKNVFAGVHRNKMFLVIIGVTIVLQAVMVEFLRKFADTERLSWVQWGACLAMAALSWPISWLVKFIPVQDKPMFTSISQVLEKLLRC